ncbi:type II toxin-antitoxin system RelE/ParE family toxin [Hamadaea sp. NPDC050747]|uniref:type II toxin-antitoxin system RelE/ParE family toxin n=1 Tax=Hamadaea sp. NPDC050747 TaxID=3155789 RepID=UPI0033F896D9
MARDEFFGLQDAGQEALGDLLTRFEHDEQRRSEIKLVGNGLFELRANAEGNQYRALFFYDGSTYSIVVVCFQKNSRKLPDHIRDLAQDRMKSWQARGRTARKQ